MTAGLAVLLTGGLTVASWRHGDAPPDTPPDDLPEHVREAMREAERADDVADEDVGDKEDGEKEREADRSSDDAEDGDDAEPQRVIVEVSRQRTEMGYVEFEDDEVIVVRTLDEEVESFTKQRVRRVIKLIEPEPGRRARLVLRDGREQTGELVEDGFEHVILKIRNIPTRFPRETVDRVVLEPTFEELYEHFKATIDPDNIDARLQFCRWLFDRGQYDLAKEEITDVLRRTNSGQARRLETLIDAQRALQERSQQADERRGGAGEGSGDSRRGRDDGRRAGPTELLSREDVNLIRVYEINFDRPPKLAVRPATIRKLVERYGTDSRIPRGASERTAMFRRDPEEIVRLMFDLRARDLYPEIEVNSEPYALNLFRQRVHDAWLVQNCATSRCHGGPDAGRLELHNRNFRDERVRMTNFMILEEMEIDPRWPLINYEEPMMSLIIQHALPRSEARLPHPDVQGWRPVFRRSNQRLLDDTVKWIESMMRPRPAYPIDFIAPNEAGGEAPAEDADPTASPPDRDPWKREPWDGAGGPDGS